MWLFSSCDFADTVFSLVNASGTVVASNDDSTSSTCRPGSEISYTVPAGEGCQQYVLRQTCYAGGVCSGTSGVIVRVSNFPTNGMSLDLCYNILYIDIMR